MATRKTTTKQLKAKAMKTQEAGKRGRCQRDEEKRAE